MLQAKKLNGRMIAVVVLSVLLAIAVTVGATLAWFADQESATGSLGLTAAVSISLRSDAYSMENDKKVLNITDLTLVPSHPIPFNINAEVANTNTPYLVRARFQLTPTLGEGEDENITATSTFQNFLKFDEGTVATLGEGETATNYTWSEMQSDGWYYLMNGSSYVVGSIHDENYDVTETPKMIGPLQLKIANGPRRVPSSWTNEYANLAYKVDLEIEATQAEVYEVTGTGSSVTYGNQIVPNSITNLEKIFKQVFDTHANA